MQNEKTGILYVLSQLGRDLLAETSLHFKSWEDGTTGYAFAVREPFYTSIPLSSLSEIAVTVNDRQVPENHVWLALREQRIPASVCRNLWELYWHIGEKAEIFITDPTLLQGGLKKKNKVALQMTVRPAYDYGLPEKKVDYAAEAEMEVVL